MMYWRRIKPRIARITSYPWSNLIALWEKLLLTLTHLSTLFISTLTLKEDSAYVLMCVKFQNIFAYLCVFTFFNLALDFGTSSNFLKVRVHCILFRTFTLTLAVCVIMHVNHLPTTQLVVLWSELLWSYFLNHSWINSCIVSLNEEETTTLTRIGLHVFLLLITFNRDMYSALHTGLMA